MIHRLCPNGHKQLEKLLFHTVEVDYCPECLGMFFDKDELTYAKDDRDNQLNWLDVNIWHDKKKFQVSPSNRRCPVCRIPFVEVGYDESNINIDFCKMCQGIWLDRGEFKQIIVYLKKKFDYEVLHRYTKNLIVQLWEVFTGPQSLREELNDFFMLLKVLNYKFMAQHPYLSESMKSVPK